MLEIAILKVFDAVTYKAAVQLMGSLTTYLDSISVATNIPESALVVGNYVIVALPGENPKDACVIASWPSGSAGGLHAETHENGGADEISLAALSGDPADTINKSLLTAQGDIITRDASGPKRLAKGDPTEVLTMGASEPEWAPAAGGAHAATHENGGADEISLAALSGDPADTINKSLLTTRGDIIVRGAAVPERLAIGTTRYFPRVNEAGTDLEYVKGFEFGPFIRPSQWELAFYDWTTTLSGSGGVTYKQYGKLGLQTGTTANSTARGRGYGFGWMGWDWTDFDWYVLLCPRALTSLGKIWLTIGADAAADPAAAAIGWRVDGAALKGTIHNGTTLTVVDLAVTIVANTGYNLFLRFVAGSKIEWYVEGVLKGESDQVPPAAGLYDHYCVFAVKNGNPGANQGAELWRHGWVWM